MGLEEFIARWSRNDGGAERANYALFLTELCAVLGVPQPNPASSDASRNDYVFERSVTRRDGSTGRIDLYKKNCFVLEAKQSRQRRLTPQGALNEKFVEADDDAETKAARGRRSSTRSWDVLMLNAREQAETYARDLPQEHGWPPFVVVCDVGHSFEVFADFQRMGKYDQFPDRMGFRIFLEDLRNEDVRARLKLIWTDPSALNPATRVELATRQLAGKLADISTALEARDEKPEEVAAFLMRCLFTMFAEDAELLPKDCFKRLLGECTASPDSFQPLLTDLWSSMDTGKYALSIRAVVRQFNGYLFKNAKVLALNENEIGILKAAADAVWREVEPAIFGTLLVRALTTKERGKLGAHFTPRAYVERLVTATIIDPLRDDWRHALAAAEERRAAKDRAGAIAVLRRFHDRLCEITVLDPACGTGNFLYVSLELMKRLEGEVLEAIAGLGGQEALTGLEGHTVGPNQFAGIELNPRALEIAELVLWIGYLQWHFRTRGGAPGEPIIKEFRKISQGDAILKYARTEAVLDAAGNKRRRWDGEHRRRDPVSKRMVPDLTYTVPVVRYVGLSIPQWPKADFIVGNPPFIGTRRLKERQGEEYVTAVRDTHPSVARTADYVMYWYFMAADQVAKGRARRCGLITTNSIVQDYSRPVLDHFISGDQPLTKLTYAITNHPWIDEADGAAVRVAMTVHAAPGDVTIPVIGEVLDVGRSDVVVERPVGRINSTLRNIPNVLAAGPLKANAAMCSQGVIPANDGFKVGPEEAARLRAEETAEPSLVKPYIIGNDLNDRFAENYIIDAFGYSEDDLLQTRPEIYNWLKKHVYEERMQNPRRSYRDNWWLFAEPRRRLRESFAGLSRFIATPYTAQHRTFQFWTTDYIPDAMVYCIPSDDPFILGVLSSSVHMTWCRYCSGTLETRPRYNSKRTFYPFPFPAAEPEIRRQLADAAKSLDEFRKDRQAAHPSLTLTAMYNVVEKVRGGRPLSVGDDATLDAGQILSLIEHHDRIDALTLRAYGWEAGLSDYEMLERLVALNVQRAADEKTNEPLWLRPDYQASASRREIGETEEMELIVLPTKSEKPLFPTSPIDQASAVAAALLSASAPISPSMVATGFKQGKGAERKIIAILQALVRTGVASTVDGGKSFLVRRIA